MAGIDYLDVSRRSFQHIYFRLTDYYGTAVNVSNFTLVTFNYFSETLRQYMYEMTCRSTLSGTSYIHHTQTPERS